MIKSNAYILEELTQRKTSNSTREHMQKYLNEMQTLYGYTPKIFVDEYTKGTLNIKWWGENTKLNIGKFCSFAKEVTIFLGGEHQPEFISTYPFLWYAIEWDAVTQFNEYHITPTKGDINIGNDVWIGHGASILSGVNIGNGAIIGANALVTKSVPDYAIVGGNPAKLIRYRFADDIIQQLLKIAWWNWPKATINQAIPALLSNNPTMIIKFAENIS